MTIPANFPYRNTYLHGRPAMSEAFQKKHPPMSQVHRAKIFAPFDALDGFDETLGTKNMRYVSKDELSEAEKQILDHRIRLLADLTVTGAMARQNRVNVTVTYFDLCTDIYHNAYAIWGTYKTASGIVWEVDEVLQTILVGETRIGFDDISRIDGDLFAGEEE